MAPTRSSPRAVCVRGGRAERWGEGGRAGKVEGGSLLPGRRLLGCSREPCPCPHPQKSPEFAVHGGSFQHSPQRKRFLFSHSPPIDSRICGRSLSLYHFSFFKNSSSCRHLPFPSPASCMSSIISFPKLTPVVYFMLLGFLNFWQNSVLSCQNTKKYISFKSLRLVISVIAAQAKTFFFFF